MTMKVIAASVTLICAAAFALPSHAAQANSQDRQTDGDVLLVEQVQKESTMKLPRRGMTMAQVQQEFGTPVNKLPTRGGDAPQHPPIHRWQYQNYIVYFANNHVIHSVINPPPAPKAEASTTDAKPAG